MPTWCCAHLGADPAVVRRRRSSALGVAEQAVTAGRPLLAPVVVDRELRGERVPPRAAPPRRGGPSLRPARRRAPACRPLCSAGRLQHRPRPRGGGLVRASPRTRPWPSPLTPSARPRSTCWRQAMCQMVDEQANAEGLQTTVPLEPGTGGLAGIERPAPDLRPLRRRLGGCQIDRRLHDGAEEVDLAWRSVSGRRGARRRVLRLLLYGRDLPLPGRAHLPPWLRPIPQRLSAWSCSRWAGECKWRPA